MASARDNEEANDDEEEGEEDAEEDFEDEEGEISQGEPTLRSTHKRKTPRKEHQSPKPISPPRQDPP